MPPIDINPCDPFGADCTTAGKSKQAASENPENNLGSRIIFISYSVRISDGQPAPTAVIKIIYYLAGSRH
jgi:hypothetical protein